MMTWKWKASKRAVLFMCVISKEHCPKAPAYTVKIQIKRTENHTGLTIENKCTFNIICYSNLYGEIGLVVWDSGWKTAHDQSELIHVKPLSTFIAILNMYLLCFLKFFVLRLNALLIKPPSLAPLPATPRVHPWPMDALRPHKWHQRRQSWAGGWHKDTFSWRRADRGKGVLPFPLIWTSN